jgi:dienelactone hydrolase
MKVNTMKSNTFHRFFLAAVLALGCVIAVAQEARTSLAAGETGRIAFASSNRAATYMDLFKHRAKFDETIVGDLIIPANADAKAPAMIVMHSSGGINPGTLAWVAFFNQMGVATFMVDSFTPRGIQSTATDQSLLSYPATVTDGLKALELLATHPRIDSKRIGVIGFSRGGIAALNSSFERIRSSVIAGDLKFALHISFYGGCIQYAKSTGSPILFLAGDNDDYFSVERCQSNIDLLKGKGANVKFVVYPGVRHGFDVPARLDNRGNQRGQMYLANGQTWKNCDIEMDIDTLTSQIKGTAEKASLLELVEYNKSCMTRGISVGPDASATEKSRAEVRAFVSNNFGLSN